MSGMAEVLAAHWFSPMDYAYCLCGADMSPSQPVGIQQALAAHQAAMLTAAGFGPVKEAGAKELEEAADAWREYLPAVAGYGNVQPVPVWLERRAEWHRRA